MSYLETIYEENEDSPSNSTRYNNSSNRISNGNGPVQQISQLKQIITRKNYEISALERRVEELSRMLEEKDQQLISMVDMGQEFKRLLEMRNVGTQVNFSELDYIFNSEAPLYLPHTQTNSMKSLIDQQILKPPRPTLTKSRSRPNSNQRPTSQTPTNIHSRSYSKAATSSTSGYVPSILRSPRNSWKCILNNSRSKMETTLLVPEKLIERSSPQLANTLDQSKSYTERFDTLGSNGVFEVKPTILYFAGFQIRRSQTKKIVVKNVSDVPQRVSILPTNTAFFQAKYNKRGQLAPGMSEQVFVQFTPSEWRYHFDCIRLMTTGGNLNVPIHAYPVMNQKERYIPSIIDLGKCPLGESLMKTVELECTVPVSFEFEIRMTVEHPDFRVQPFRGDVPANGSAFVEILYEPSIAATATAEIELRLSEFDYQPITSKVIASAFHKRPEQSVFSESAREVPTPQSRTLLLNSKEASSERLPRKLPELLRPNERKQVQKLGQLLKPRFIDRIILEQQFNTEYRQLEELDREKEFKIHRSIGNEHPTDDFVNDVLKDREAKNQKKLDQRRQDDISQDDVDKDKDKVIYDVAFQLPRDPTWNYLMNDAFSLRELPLNRFLKLANKVMVRLRAEKRLQKLRRKLEEHGVNNRAKALEFIAWDWKQADLIGLGKSDFIPFDFKISSSTIKPCQFPNQLDANIEEFNKKIEISPVLKFDKLQKLDLIETQEYLVHNLPDFTAPPSSYYLPIENEHGQRNCAEEEYSNILPKGDLQEHPPFELPINCLKPEVIDPVGQVRPHPKLRTFINLDPVTETRPEMYLINKEFPSETIEVQPGDIDLQKPLLANEWRPIRSREAVSIPEPLNGPRVAEILSDSDSDSGNVFKLEIPNLDTYLEAFEAGDAAVHGQPRLSVDIKEETINSINLRLREQRIREMALFPTFLTEANRLIENPSHKVAIAQTRF